MMQTAAVSRFSPKLVSSRPVAGTKKSTVACPARANTDDAVLPPPPSPGMRPRSQLRKCEAKERSRGYRQTVFDFEYWANHRSSDRYFLNMATMVQSRIIRSLAIPLAWSTSVAVLVCINCTMFEQGILPAMIPHIPLSSALPVNLTAFALSLLLVFRTNSSYGRFDEARKMWGLMLNRSRDIVRQAVTYYPVEDLDAKGNLSRWTMVFSIALKAHLQPGQDLQGDVKGVLSERETKLLMDSDHKVLAALQMISECVESADISGFQKMQMHANITTFEDILGGCERLLRTPIPLSYTRHTSRFLLIWLTALPFCLYSTIGWGTVPAEVLIALLLLGIEEIGIEIEEPFGILPLDVISNKARSDIIELMNRQALMKSVLTEDDLQVSVNTQVFSVVHPSEVAQNGVLTR